MRVGEPVRVKVAVSREGKVAGVAGVSVRFWAPGRDPSRDAEVAARPDAVADCAFDEAARRWTAVVPTDGWAPGAWTASALVTASSGARSGGAVVQVLVTA